MEYYWNYRIIEFVEKNGDAYQSIHEVHYNKEGNPYGYAEGGAIVQWDVDEADQAPISILDKMRKAIDLPVLLESDFYREEPPCPQKKRSSRT